MKVTEIVNVSIGLSRTPPSQANFSVPILMVDHADIPVDRRYRTVTRESYLTDLTAATDQYNWCAAFWGQNYNPALAYIGRWISAATSPHFICKDATEVLATWTAIVDGSLTVTTTAGADALAAMSFAAATSIADVCAVIDAALVAGGVSGARCALDALDRIVFTDAAVTGAGVDAVVLSGGGAGTDLYLAAYLSGATGFAVGGLDIEAQGVSLNAILALDNTPFAVCQRGGSISQVVAFSTSVNALDKILLLVCNDTDAKDSASTTDFPYLIKALSHQKTHIGYTEHTTQHPDAAICGEILPQAEASTSFALTPFSGLSESGLDADGTTVIPLTSDEILALEAKGTDFLINPAGSVHFRHGLAVGGNEMRIMIGKSYMAAKVSEEIYGYLLVNNVVTYSDEDIQAFKSTIVYWSDILVDRKVLDAATIEIDMPLAEDFTAADKATHTMTLNNVFSADAQSAVNDMVITMSFTV